MVASSRGSNGTSDAKDVTGDFAVSDGVSNTLSSNSGGDSGRVASAARHLQEGNSKRSILPQWAQSNTIAAVTSIVAGVSAFGSTWFLLSPAVETTNRTVLIGLVVGNIVVAGILILLVGTRILHVWSDRRHQLAGSRMHMQLVRLFSLVAVVPAAIAFLFAFTILQTSLNDVFSKRIDKYQGTAKTINNSLVDVVLDSLRGDMFDTGIDITRQELLNIGLARAPVSFRDYLEIQRRTRGFSAFFLLDGNRSVIARIVDPDIDTSKLVLPTKSTFDTLDRILPDENSNQLVNINAFQFGANDLDQLDFWRGVLKLDVYGGGYLVAYLQISPKVSQSIKDVRVIDIDWKGAVQGRRRVERVFVAGYIVLGVTILFAAIWAALSAATQIVGPIGRLVGMADKVSAGDLTARVSVERRDGEIGALAQSMNRMTSQLQTQRNDLIETNRRFDRRRRFTEAVLSGVSAGVIGVGADGRITIANSSAAELLGIGPTRMIGEDLMRIAPELAALFEEAKSADELEIGGQVEFYRDGRNATLNVRIVHDDAAGERTYVVTFDDITQLISAQRNAAWGDVARRIAHEIKNPLTPIQLSAERLRRKYLHEIQSSPEIFDKCTETIIRQVNDIGRMVDEFSSFARMPKPVISTEDFRELAKSAIFPQRVTFPDIQFDADFPTNPMMVNCDGRLIVQALTNLIKNAAESVTARLGDEENPAAVPGKIHLEMEHVEQRDGAQTSRSVDLHIIDNGIGLPQIDRHRLAEPYMTTRVKGTGLGLAIVKKVAEEHGGTLLFNDDDRFGRRGARITLRLPIATASKMQGPSTDLKKRSSQNIKRDAQATISAAE